ncbi:hypothetical protein [Citrobacter koseri]|uniref:hypothetical protein n=1 Tax=Citrobacter koseri TaxID=545 RepID=UPI0038915345
MHFKIRLKKQSKIKEKVEFERQTQKFFNGIKNNFSLVPFLCATLGAWFLQAFAVQHFVKFMDLINTPLLITVGAIFLIILMAFSTIIIPAVYFSSKITKLAVSKITKPTEKNKIPYALFLTHALVSGILSYNLSYAGIFGIILAYCFSIIIYMLINMKDGNLLSTIKNAIFVTGLLITIIFISYVAFGFPIIILNYNTSDIFDGEIITAITVSLITWVLTSVSYTSPDNNTRQKVVFYTSLIVCSSFAASILLETQFSEKIVRIIGMGLQERCYYTTDLEKYRIPTELITRIDNQRTKLFVVADTGEKVYISRDSLYKTSFIFKNDGLSETPCGGSINAKPNYLPYNTI